MNCDDNSKRAAMSLALGELGAADAAAAERHLAACPECAALAAAVKAQRAAIASAPLPAAGAGFAGDVRGALAAGESPAFAAVLVAAAACCAALLIFWPQARRPAPEPPPASSLTPGFINTCGAQVPGGAGATDFLNALSLRAPGTAPSAGGTVRNFKEGI